LAFVEGQIIVALIMVHAAYDVQSGSDFGMLLPYMAAQRLAAFDQRAFVVSLSFVHVAHLVQSGSDFGMLIAVRSPLYAQRLAVFVMALLLETSPMLRKVVAKSRCSLS
jgi:hypothetical protein